MGEGSLPALLNIEFLSLEQELAGNRHPEMEGEPSEQMN